MALIVLLLFSRADRSPSVDRLYCRCSPLYIKPVSSERQSSARRWMGFGQITVSFWSERCFVGCRIQKSREPTVLVTSSSFQKFVRSKFQCHPLDFLQKLSLLQQNPVGSDFQKNLQVWSILSLSY
jgi:hypothetical protein